MTELELQKLKINLADAINNFLDDVEDMSGIGWVPDDITERMTDAAFSVLLAIKSTNDWIDNYNKNQ